MSNTLVLLSGSANQPLARAIAQRLGVALGECEVRRHPDGELGVRVGTSVRGCDVFLVQPTSPPVETHLMELLLLADACRRAGAARVSAVVPYFGYARGDRRASGREPVATRLVADLLTASGLDRVVGVDLHTSSIEGFFTIPIEHLSAVPLLAEAVRPHVSDQSVIVAPDLGATTLAERYGNLLSLPIAIVHKSRVSGAEVVTTGITGEVAGRAPIVVDDMISTGGTILATLDALSNAGALPGAIVSASHGLLVGPAVQRLRVPATRQLLLTDSVAAVTDPAVPHQTVSLAPLLADAIARLHEDRSLADLLLHR